MRKMLIPVVGSVLVVVCAMRVQAARPDRTLDDELAAVLAGAGFTGRIESTLQERPFGDSQSIAIGVQNNGIVGPNRTGPRNQRKAPVVINSAFFPRQMLNGRFKALSDDPFDNSLGFEFPPPEGTGAFPPLDPVVRTLLAAQGHIPQTEFVEMAGFTGTAGTIGFDFDQFDDGVGTPLPPPGATGFRNDPIRAAVLARFNQSEAYLRRFGRLFNGGAPFPPGGIEFHMIARTIAEFQISLTFADAPIDRFARGHRGAMSSSQKEAPFCFSGKRAASNAMRLPAHRTRCSATSRTV